MVGRLRELKAVRSIVFVFPKLELSLQIFEDSFASFGGCHLLFVP